MGGRDPGEVELALHELGLKELVRPARASSMEGETEYSFWHLLVRDVAYSQIPRVERARRHRAAAAWIERKGGRRVEDLAEVLAHHYLQALELAEAAGDAQQAVELAAPARRFLAFAGERALGLDTAQAVERFARALELTAADDPERPVLLSRWADATFQAGRPREADDALEQAVASLRAHGATEAAARALRLQAAAAFQLGEARYLALAAEAVALLEREAPGPARALAYAVLASWQFVAGAYAEAIASAERARALAETHDLPEPNTALGAHGLARAALGDADGLTEVERAIALFIEQGVARDAASLRNNLALARYPFQGPARSLAAIEQGIAFCEQRGLAELAMTLEGNCPLLLAELGRPEKALERAARIAAVAEASGMTLAAIESRAVELAIRVARGQAEAPPAEVEELVARARTSGAADVIVMAFAPAAAALAANTPTRASGLLAELQQTPGARATVAYGRQLTAMLRTALVAADPGLAGRLADRLEPPRYPLDRHVLCAARAQLAEYASEHAEAVSLYAEAAARWHEFGHVPERAYALLGQGRCLRALRRPGADQPLREARDLFARMGYQPALVQSKTLLEQIAPAPSS